MKHRSGPPIRTARMLPGDAYVLGEGASWDSEAGIVRWVDIDCGRVYESEFRMDAISPRLVFECGPTVGASAPVVGGGLLVAGARDLLRVAPSGQVVCKYEVIPPEVQSRLNDGTTDPQGRYLVGTLSLDDRTGEERLVRLENDGRVRVLDDDLKLSNGLAFSPDGRLFYSIDTLDRVIWVRDYQPEGEYIGSRREAFRLEAGMPDGLACDEDGTLWIAMWGAGQVHRYTPNGELIEIVKVGTPLTTSVAFVGPKRDALLITTASVAQSGTDLGAKAGRLAIANVDAIGLPETPWSPPAG